MKTLCSKYITVIFFVQNNDVVIMPNYNTKYNAEQLCNILHIEKFNHEGINIVTIPLITSFNFKQTYISGKLLNKIYKKHIFFEKSKFSCINYEVLKFR